MKHLLLNILFASFLGLIACESTIDPQPADCVNSSLEIISVDVTDVSSCDASDGSIQLSVRGGETPYEYSLNGGALVNDASFNNLSSGSYTVEVTDKNGCSVSREVGLGLSNGLTVESVAVEAVCGTSDGSIVVTATSNSTPQFKLNDGSFQSSGTFNSLTEGTYTLTVIDNSGCEIVSTVVVPKIYTEVKSILSSRCASCHSWASDDNLVKSRASTIKTRVNLPGSDPLSMPKGANTLPQDQIDAINCWVDNGANI